MHSLNLPERCCRFCLWVAHKHPPQFSICISMCAASLNDLKCLFMSFCVRVWKVNHSGRQSWSLLYWTVSTVCCLLRGAVLERTTWLMVAVMKLCHTWHTYLNYFPWFLCGCLMNKSMRTTVYYFTVLSSCCHIYLYLNQVTSCQILADTRALIRY